MHQRPDLRGFISIDIEASGSHPGRYAMLSLGACSVVDPSSTFYAELQPTTLEFEPEAMAVHGLSLEHLQKEGMAPDQAMTAFADWIRQQAPSGYPPVFVAYNAVFDWMFVTEYFFRSLGRNPFGHTALDIRAVYFGLTHDPWRAIRFADLAARYLNSQQLTHHALEDAQLQAALLRAMLASGPPIQGGKA
ncbi:MAG TPA: 3'-5' exonuclease [Anaerolineales bacterium]|nr:3'-5' exonuclease [Anaerolineales bacterium]